MNGLPLVDEAALIPFKATAYLDLRSRKAAGDKVDSKDIRKHRNDVFRLLQLLPANTVRQLPDPIAGDLAAFLKAVAAEGGFRPADFDVKMSPDEALSRLAASYGL